MPLPHDPGDTSPETRLGAGGVALSDSATEAPTGFHPTSMETSDCERVGRAAFLPDPEGPLVPGEAFGPRYRIVRLLGLGGMGAVYEARDAELGVSVAIKVIRREANGNGTQWALVEQRFKRELLLAREVTHKNVVRIHDLGEIEGTKYITMSFVDGKDLATVLRDRGKLPVREALCLARQIADGLQAAHDAGVVHRDLKPANIMLDRSGHALIMDFGIARLGAGTGRRAAAAPSIGTPAAGWTFDGGIVGTLHYMAPEQARGETVDHRADIFAFGLILGDMLLGLREKRDPPAALRDRLEKGLPALRATDPGIPEAVELIASRCLEVDPGKRYQATAELTAALATLDEDGQPLPEPRRLTWRIAAAGLLVVAALSAGLAWLTRPAPAPPAPAPVSVLIADLQNASGEAVFERTLEQALVIALEGASFVTAYPRVDAERILARLTPGAKLDEAGARLVARREGIRAVVAGSLLREGSRYRLRLRLVNPASDAPAALFEGTARKDEVLRKVGDLAGRIRQSLGDRTKGAELAAAAETFTAGSLEAVHAYATGQELLLRRRHPEAIPYFREAVAHDPKFGRAYAGWAVAAFTAGRTDEASEQWTRALSLMDRMTDREKYRTLGTHYMGRTRDFDKAIDTFKTLVRLYPADTAGHNNLAYAYFFTRNFLMALEEGRRAMQLIPGSLLFRSNYALYAMYAGDFTSGRQVAESILGEDPSSYAAYLPLAVGEVLGGEAERAHATYERMAATGAAGASGAATGLADLALYLGRPADARTVLARSIADDEQAGNTAELTAKHLAMAEAWLMEGDRRAAIAEANRARASGSGEEVLVPLAHLGLSPASEAVAAIRQLGSQVAMQTRAYGKVVEGELALARAQPVAAVDAFRAAAKLADLWLARYGLGVAYVRAGLYAEGLSELETCQKRRGEATAIFFDDRPTLRYLVPLSYWLGRAKEGLDMREAAARDYRQFLALRAGQGLKDPLAADARERVGKL